MGLLRGGATGACGLGKRGRVRFRGLLQHHDLPSAVRRHSDPKHMPAALPGECDVMQRC